MNLMLRLGLGSATSRGKVSLPSGLVGTGPVSRGGRAPAAAPDRKKVRISVDDRQHIDAEGRSVSASSAPIREAP